MDRRIESLERTSADIRESMARMEGKVDAIDKHSATKADLIGMESRMVKWFVGTALAMTGLAVAISFGIARLIL